MGSVPDGDGDAWRRFSKAKQLEVSGKFRKAVSLIVEMDILANRKGKAGLESASQGTVPADREPTPGAKLDALARAELETAVNAKRHGSRVYESLQNLNEVIGTQYGDRVLYELIQNAHDAHNPGEQGRISIRLIVQSGTEGCLFIANCGTGFRMEDVEAIRNLAISAKEIGEGIGNKGLGFRSIEALTDDVRIYSQEKAQQSERFDGYCFRFANAEEVEAQLHSNGVETEIAKVVARTVPRFLIPRPLYEQSDDIAAFARSGYATVIVAPLRSSQAVDLATEQVQALCDPEAPLLLFLERIGEVRIEMQPPDQVQFLRLLRRRQISMGEIPKLPGCGIYTVDVGEGRRFLVVRREVDKERVRESVQRSIPKAPQLKRWLNWKGQPIVSVAVGLFPGSVIKGRLYNFLPMGKEALAPLIGYLDAPFFADIDRRNADLELPLNETLMQAAAEASAAAALFIVECVGPIPAHAVFDLIAWTGDHAGKLDNALEGAGSSLREAPVIPAIAVEGQGGWSSLSEISLWPEGTFSVLKAKEVARYVGAQLVSPDLDERRVRLLEDLAARTYRSLSPTAQRLAMWAEAFARSLADRKVGPRTWSRFYAELERVFAAPGADLDALTQKSIFYDRSGKLRPAGGHGGISKARIYVRSEASKGKRTNEGIPLPPSTLMRRYRFLDERITFRRETLDAFLAADLIREYDPTEALAGLKSALGGSANDKRRQEALLWSFQVWLAAGSRVEDELRDAELYVPTLSGWQPAAAAAFSSSWTMVGRTLENYLVEAAEVSVDCRRARELLLVGHQVWPDSSDAMKRQWVRFLELTGVAAGLRPIPGRLTRKGWPAYTWYSLLHSGQSSEGLAAHWCAEVAHVSFNHPYTDYQMRGEAWRFPGQLEHDKLPETAREGFCALVFDHLKAHGNACFEFKVGRFDRPYEREWDLRTLPTPLATFLRSKRWIAANTREGLGFRRPKECWAAQTRGSGPPRFVDRVPETAADLGVGQLLFSQIIGLRNWQSKETALDRLKDLAMIVADLASNDRPTFRREYKRAWLDIVETSAPLPADLNLVVTRRGQLEVLSGETDKRLVVVTQDAQRFEASVLSWAGKAVLEVGETSTERVAALLEVTGGFLPRRIDGIGVQLLVDGEPFVPRVADPLLTSLGLDWLPEVVVIGHELLGEQLERGILISTVERRARSIRVRRGEEISLVVDGDEISPTEHMGYHAFPHEDLPTLLLTNAFPLNWTNLARYLSGSISQLIDGRLRSLERLLSRLALERLSEELDAPSDEELARALECDVQTVQEHRAALRTDLKHVLHMLIPVVAYYGDADLARQLTADAERAALKFDVGKWLKRHLVCMEYSPEALLDACGQVADRTELRRRLELDYGKLNRVLVELGEPMLSNEAELRRLYEAYLARMSPTIIERLRRHHYEDFRNGRDLATFVERKSLAFLPFNSEWVLTRETLEMAVVEEHVSRLLEEALGVDMPVELASLNRVIEMNRKSVREFAGQALPVIRVWCRKHGLSIPEVWQHAEPQAIARHLENSGFLDFETITLERIPSLCRRTVCWPDGMAETIDRTALNLEDSEVEEEERRRGMERQRLEIARRSIEFGGRSLDTGDPTFAADLRQLAEEWLSTDVTWFERSRQRVMLIEVQNPVHDGGGGKGGTIRKRERQLTDAQREAMGLAGEWLALQFLRRRHPGYVDDTCWISQNRTRFFGGDEGDDAAGYDFRVKTPQAEWLYEVKSSLEDNSEFELTANELRVASSASKDVRRKYRVLYVPYVFSPDKWYLLELPNPMGERTRSQFQTVGRGSVRVRFETR